MEEIFKKIRFPIAVRNDGVVFMLRRAQHEQIKPYSMIERKDRFLACGPKSQDWRSAQP